MTSNFAIVIAHFALHIVQPRNTQLTIIPQIFCRLSTCNQFVSAATVLKHCIVCIIFHYIVQCLHNYRNLSVVKWSDICDMYRFFGKNGVVSGNVFRQKVLLLHTHRAM